MGGTLVCLGGGCEGLNGRSFFLRFWGLNEGPACILDGKTLLSCFCCCCCKWFWVMWAGLSSLLTSLLFLEFFIFFFASCSFSSSLKSKASAGGSWSFFQDASDPFKSFNCCVRMYSVYCLMAGA